MSSSEMSDFETSDRALEILSQWMEQKPKDVSATIETFMESNCDGTVELVSRFFSRAFRKYISFLPSPESDADRPSDNVAAFI